MGFEPMASALALQGYIMSSELNIFDAGKFQSNQHKETGLGHLHECIVSVTLIFKDKMKPI